MAAPRSRARWLRGTLVGGTSAAMTAGAHSAAGGGLPNGPALILALLACATMATVVGCFRCDGRGAGWLVTTAALCAAQMSGHAALVTAGHHHAGAAVELNPTMAATHIGAAAVLGLAITAAEYLYMVCVSVLCWLRVFALSAPRPAARVVRRTANIVVVQPVLLSGLGMRAPPRRVAAA